MDKPTEDDLAKTLEGLSAAATQGEWGIWREPISSRHDAIAELTEQVDATKSISDALVLLDAGGLCPASTGCGPTSDANAEFITALVNLYRTGKLIVVPDDAVERMARNIEPAVWDQYDRSLQPFAENRGAYNGTEDPVTYEMMWRDGCRNVEEAKNWWAVTDRPVMVRQERWRESLSKATAVLAALKGADHAG